MEEQIVGNYRTAFEQIDLTIKREQNETRKISHGLTPKFLEVIYLGNYKFRLRFIYMVKESHIRKGVNGYFDIQLLVGKYTGKIMGATFIAKSIEEFIASIDEIIKCISSRSKTREIESVKWNHQLIAKFLTANRSQFRQDFSHIF